jgi:hypothetical protein
LSQVTPTVLDAGERQVSRSVVVDAPVGELFELVANPHRHHELDGSGTVRDQAKGPDRLSEGDTFVVRMKMFGIPYTITSTATQIEQDRVVEWKHPGGHRWRYEFESLGPSRTQVTETFDYRHSKAAKVYELIGIPGRNAAGIESTLQKLAREHSG